ncbi:efflux RND transporter periplasmic adaptor subunit [Thaumasiovibrio sp. DFM-14]|uniref:efflux RND transporter periplasmic adaptor subunit n=1 Tax=Thaumasiovibrio sp. DFM-14 TaxID=3384792 RepID=UPI0039A3F1AA
MNIKLAQTPAFVPFICLILWGCNTSTLPSQPEANIPVANVIALDKQTHFTVQREYSGTIAPANHAAIGFEFGGKVDKVWVSTGDKTKQGDPLVSLDQALLKTQQRQLLAQQSEINAQQALIEANLHRQQALKKKGFSADAEIDALSSQKLVLDANLNQLKASLQSLSLQLDKSTIYAPYNGIISSRKVAVGDVVSPGQPTVTLLSNEQLEVHIGVPADMFDTILAQSDYTVRIGQYHYQARLLRQAGQIDLNSRTQRLTFSLNQVPSLISGQLAYLVVDEIVTQNNYQVPLSALTDGVRGVWNVFAVNQDSHIERRTVNVLYTTETEAIIDGALTDGDIIIANGLHRLVPGQQVTWELGVQ